MHRASFLLVLGAAILLAAPARAGCVAAPPAISCENGVRVVRGAGVQPFVVEVPSAGTSAVVQFETGPFAGSTTSGRGLQGTGRNFACLGRDCRFLAKRFAAPQAVVVLDPGVRIILPHRAPKRFGPSAFVKHGALVVPKHQLLVVPKHQSFVTFGRRHHAFAVLRHKPAFGPPHRGGRSFATSRAFGGRGLVRPGGFRR